MTDQEQGESRTPLIQLKGITKTFGSLRANNQIDLTVQPGEIHALLGENGAGKSTLMNILYGLYHPDEGEILLRGEPVQINSPRDAIQHRIGMIHQHFMLIPNLSVIENVVMGLSSRHGPLLDLKAPIQRLQELADTYGLEVDPQAMVRDLPVGVQQRVEILKALYRGADLLILDEPTAVLSPFEVGDFFRVLRDLVARGMSVIFISHKLDEVLEISDRITVLRHGEKMGTVETSASTKQSLAEMMVGRKVFLQIQRSPSDPGQPVLEVRDLIVRNTAGKALLTSLNLTIRAGEVMGIAGVDGNGQRELAEVLSGLLRADEGTIRIRGNELVNHDPATCIKHRVSYIPADRQQVGLVLDFSVEENLILKQSDKAPFAQHRVLNRAAIREHALAVIERYDIRTAGRQAAAYHLSGGNQQKLILAREIENNPALLIATHPTRGLDVGATEYIHRRILEQRDSGVAILLISADLDEILSLSDYVAVMFRGEIMGVVPGQANQLDNIGHMMLGERLGSIT